MVDILKPVHGPTRTYTPKKASPVQTYSDEKQDDVNSDADRKLGWDGKRDRRNRRDRRGWRGEKNRLGFDLRAGYGRRKTDRKGANITVKV